MNTLIMGIGIGLIIGWTLAVTYIYYSQKKLLGNRWDEFNELLNKRFR